MSDPAAEFIAAMGAAGMGPLEPIAQHLNAGRLCRFRCEGDSKGRRNGWAILHLDGLTPWGAFGNWRLGTQHKWRSGEQGRSLTRAERQAIADAARKNEAERRRETGRAAEFSREMWRHAGPASPEHPYLVRKGLPPHGIRQRGADLIVPLVDETALLWNVQRIGATGDKLFMKGGRVKGLFFPFGVWPAERSASAGPLVLAEGWATATAIHCATGFGVAAAMNAGNMLSVATSLRMMFPVRQLIVAADWDGADGGIGVRMARTAAEACRASLAIPLSHSEQRRSGALRIDFADISPETARRLIRNASIAEVAHG